MTWEINETKKANKGICKAPKHIQQNYQYWKLTMVHNGPEWVKHNMKGARLESLAGKRKNQYSCRLSKGYRVIFEINNNELTILVLEVNKHEY